MFRLVILFVQLAVFANAQVQWADSLVAFSSEYSKTTCSAKEILGPPSVMPQKGSTSCAWSGSKPESEMVDYVELSYKTPQQVQQIIVAEPFNPGAVFEIYLYSVEGKKFKVFQQVPKAVMPLDKGGRLFFIKIAKTPYLVNRLRLVMMNQNVPGYNLIDAIGICTDTMAYEVKIETITDADNVTEPENLGPLVNSSAAELAPLISPDGKILYFTRQNHPNNIANPNTQDIWFSKKNEDASFAMAENIGGPINNAQNNALCSVTPDGQTLMLMNKYLPGDKSENGISLSYRTATGWSFPEALEIKDFYNKSKTGEYCLSANTQSILMAIERNDAIGDKDIYVSHKTADGKWSAPFNLGKTINTAESETSPYLAPDGKTLYFATSGFPGYGSMDMFVSRRLDDSWTNWSRPQNLGPKLNSTGFDAYYSIPASGDYAYFSSNKNSKASSDIFRVKLPQSAKPQAVVLIKGKVVNAKTKEPITAAIKFESLTDSTKIGFARSNPTNGEYSIVLPAGTVYGFLAVKDGFLSVGENLNLEKTSEYKELTINLNLTAIETGAFITLNNLFFDFSKFDIKTENLPELKRLLSLLNLYPNMEIEISGHTDNIGTDQANLLLSSNRAKAVADYLFSKGISKNRIKSVGKGKTMPAADNSTEEGRALNRRIEMKIIKVE